MSLTEELAAWVCALAPADVSDEAWAAAERCLLDHLGCAVGGAGFEAGAAALSYIEAQGAPGPCTVFGSTERVSARDAVFANAASANALDFDDTYHGHPGATVWPAALAAGEVEDADGRTLLLGAIVGYEITIRLMARLQPLLARYEQAWDLGTVQTFGAAAAYAKIRGSSPEELANAWAIASASAPVPLGRKPRVPGPGGLGIRSMIKSAYGWAVAAAVTAVDIGAHGMCGPTGALEAPMGLWGHPDTAAGDADLADGLGEEWLVTEVEHKPYMACRFIHASIEALERAVDGDWPHPSEIAGVQVEAHSLLADEHHAIPSPENPTEAIFSVPHVLASLITDAGGLGPSTYRRDRLEDPELQRLRDRVSVVVDPEIDALFPTEQVARVTVSEEGGRTRSAEVRVPKGSADRPLSAAELRTKFDLLVAPTLGAAGAERAAAAAADITASSTRQLLATFTARTT